MLARCNGAERRKLKILCTWGVVEGAGKAFRRGNVFKLSLEGCAVAWRVERECKPGVKILKDHGEFQQPKLFSEAVAALEKAGTRGLGGRLGRVMQIEKIKYLHKLISDTVCM